MNHVISGWIGVQRRSMTCSLAFIQPSVASFGVGYGAGKGQNPIGVSKNAMPAPAHLQA
jgi:hypothetical protein